jgi:outer membrane lipoprotein-sorting protein
MLSFWRKPESPALIVWPNMETLKLSLRALFLLLPLSLAIPAAPAMAVYRLSQQDKADIARIEAYLNRVDTLRSRFVQLSSDGNFAEGVIYIERPKRLRLQYTNPSNIQVYANGFWLVHVDTELEAVWHVPINTTAASFLVRDKIAFRDDFTVRRVIRQPRLISVELFQTDEPESGKFILTFADQPLGLRKWTVTDAQGISTSVTLAAPAFNVAIPGDVFVFDETKFDREQP